MINILPDKAQTAHCLMIPVNVTQKKKICLVIPVAVTNLEVKSNFMSCDTSDRGNFERQGSFM